jgi:hypothetical protein
MKAYRARAAEVCVRLEPKTMATLDSIAEEIGYSRNELMQSMVKFGLTNRDWRNEGLTAHKRLPRYQENPGMATKPLSAAQLAARARFAEMARSGSLNRKRQIAAKKRAENPVETEMRYQIFRSNGGIDSTYKTLAQMKNALDEIDNPPGKFYGYDSVTGTTYRSFAYNTPTRKSNPAKKTVSQKISQLVHEGYPQRQAVAVALNEERAGKVKRNPARKAPARMVHAYALVCMHPEPHTVALVDTLAHAKEIARDYSDRHNVPVAIRSIDVHAAHFIP